MEENFDAESHPRYSTNCFNCFEPNQSTVYVSLPFVHLISCRPAFCSLVSFTRGHLIIVLCPSALSSRSLPLLISHLPFVIHHVPDDLEVPQVIIAQQLVLLRGVEQREILHDDGCSGWERKISTYTDANILLLYVKFHSKMH